MVLAFSRVAWRLRHRACKVCDARYPFVTISASGLCPDHSKMRMRDNNAQLREHSGPWFDHWRQRSLAALGVGLPDGTESS